MTIIEMTAPKAYSHLTLTGPYAGRPLCNGFKDPALQHYHAVYAPAFVFTSPDTCPECLRIWNEAKDDEPISGQWEEK